MPYLHLSASPALSQADIAALRDEIATLMPILPGKTRENTMIHITGGCAISKGDPTVPAAFIEIHTYKASPDEAKKEFAAKVTALVSEKLGVPGENIYMNIIALDEWFTGRK